MIILSYLFLHYHHSSRNVNAYCIMLPYINIIYLLTVVVHRAFVQSYTLFLLLYAMQVKEGKIYARTVN